jgi:tetratricopeptide (TPR) repeat protein
MRILLFDLPSNMAFTVATPEQQPLGGMASCICYLARALAARGHDVTLAAVLPDGTPPVVMGVRHVPVKDALADAPGFFRQGGYDAVIAVNYPDIAPVVKNASPKTVTAAWLHVYPDQPALAPLKALEGSLDAAVCVSATLRDAVRHSIPALSDRTVAIGNAISPFFENMFSSAEDVLAAKQNRAVYASMPFRGLDLLVEVMGRVGGTVELDVYSSMRTYQLEEKNYAALYDLARRNPRIRHHGSVGQRALAEAFRGAAYLTYPSTFIESYCIVAQEAIAAGLKVISNDLGALPETTLGYADLLPVQGGAIARADHIAGITRLVEKNQAEFQRDPRAWAEARFAQLQAVNRECTWARRAAAWEARLEQHMAAPRRSGGAEQKHLSVGGVAMSAGLEQAVLQQRMGNLDAAERGCAEVVRLEPDNAVAHHFRGVLLSQRGRHGEALASFDRAVALNPAAAEPHYNRGIALCHLGRHEDALTCFGAALKIQPNYVEALLTRGVILHGLGRPEQALASYDTALAVQPSAELLYNRATVLAALARLGEALDSLDRALALKADYADAWTNRGAILQAMNRFDEAIASFDRALALNPGLAAARQNREHVLRRLGRI